MDTAQIRAQAEEAIMAHLENEGLEGPRMLLGWVVSYEYTTPDLEDRQETACGVITAGDSQSRSTSRGVLELGVDRFRV